MEQTTLQEEKRDYAVLVGLRSPVLGDDSADEESLAELSALVDTAGGQAVGMILQSRDKPDPHSFIGEGKVEVYRDFGAVRETFYSGVTDSSGIADRILLPALPASLGLSSDTAGISGTAYTVAVSHPDYHCPEHQQVLVFPCIESVLSVTLPPQREEG